MTPEDRSIVARHRPSEHNKVCECAGGRVCVRHELIGVIDRLDADIDMRMFAASHFACYEWPEDTPEHIALRKAYLHGAMSTGPQRSDFSIGDQVDKRDGYKFPGTVRSVYLTEKSEVRIVVELSGFGLQHIFRPDQFCHRVTPSKP